MRSQRPILVIAVSRASWVLFVVLSSFGCTTSSGVVSGPSGGAAAVAAYHAAIAAQAPQRAGEPVAEQEEFGPLGHHIAELHSLSLTFIDPESLEVFEAEGPFTPVYWDETRLDLVGRDAAGLGSARVTLLRDQTGTWAHARVRDREFLIRLP